MRHRLDGGFFGSEAEACVGPVSVMDLDRRRAAGTPSLR